MSQTRYGIRRFALLNTAGYSLGIFPLENPLSIYGANNLGKSASINALQFPILARLSDMSFGKYSMEQSRRFYFASDTSYILLELMLPPSSTDSGSRPWSARCSTRMKVNSARRWAVLFTWAPTCSGTK